MFMTGCVDFISGMEMMAMGCPITKQVILMRSKFLMQRIARAFPGIWRIQSAKPKARRFIRAV
jgi:hypothetical protein